MPHRNEQPTLFELTACGEFEQPPGLPRDGAAPGPSPNRTRRLRKVMLGRRGREESGPYHPWPACRSARSARLVGAKSPEVAL
jgi:hypothetical protein